MRIPAYEILNWYKCFNCDNRIIRPKQRLIEYIDTFPEDSSFVTYYAVNEFESFFADGSAPTQNKKIQNDNYKLLSGRIDGFIIDDTEFFTLNGSAVLASGISGFNDVDISETTYQKNGSKRDYRQWVKSRLNDRLIKEMSEANECDAIITANVKDFKDVPSTYAI